MDWSHAFFSYIKEILGTQSMTLEWLKALFVVYGKDSLYFFSCS